MFGLGKKRPEAPSTKAEKESFGGQTKAEAAKQEEQETMETMPYGELLEKVGAQAKKVKESLDKERDLSAEVRKAGGKITKETADRVAALERQLNGLTDVWTRTLEPVRREASAAVIEGDQFLVVKPEELEALMTDPDMIELPDSALVEEPETAEMKAYEKALQEVADKARDQMDAVKREMEAVYAYQVQHEGKLLLGDKETVDRTWRDYARRWSNLAEDLAQYEARLKEVRENLGFVEKRIEKRAA